MCFNDPSERNLMLLWKFCSRGSLQELLHNEDIRLEESFKNAFIRDIVKVYYSTFHNLAQITVYDHVNFLLY